MKIFMGLWLIQFALCFFVSFLVTLGDIKETFKTLAFIEIFISVLMVGVCLICL